MDLTSWWPRPKAEGVVEELARLQQGQPPAASPTGIRAGGAFPRADRKGYDVGQVDALLARLPELTAREIRGARFGTARKGGYDMGAVDEALERFATEAEARGA